MLVRKLGGAVRRNLYVTPTLGEDGRIYWAAYYCRNNAYVFAGLVVAADTSGQALDTLAWLGTNKRP